MIERIGTWKPSEWPEIGDDKIIPTSEADYVIATVVAVEEDHVVVRFGLKRWKGFPRVIRIKEMDQKVAIREVWDFEEA